MYSLAKVENGVVVAAYQQAPEIVVNGIRYTRDTVRRFIARCPAKLIAFGYYPVVPDAQPQVDNFSVLQPASIGQFVVTETHVQQPWVVVEKDANQCAEIVIAAIVAKRSAVAHGGVTYLGRVFDTSEKKVNSITMIANSISTEDPQFPELPNQIPWDTKDGVPLTHNKTQFLKFARAVGKHFTDCTINADTHRNAVLALLAANDRAGIVAYDYSTGWPANVVE
jgi:hypothetical protein